NLSGEAFPEYYPSLIEGVFHENWGLAGLAPWAYDSTEAYKNSSSAKIIGNRLYCLIDGVEELQEQRLSDRRRLQLKKALLLGTPEERLEAGFHEVYLQNGIRVTIYSGERTKDGQDVMVFRKYVLKELTFENMAAFGTIPKECIPLLYAMTEIGFNVLFSGQVRSGKTTFMICWQKYEDIRLEGLAIATDPETPWHEIMPDAPIMQIVADGEDLARITKSLLRGDNDYVLLEEMRDATAFNLALDITSTGTQRSKGTIHTNKAADIPYKMASKIIAKYGGDLNAVISQVFQNFNYVLEFFQVSTDKAQKRLKGISEFRYDEQKDECSIHRICDYSYEADSWTFVYDIGEDKRQLGLAYPESMKKMETVLEHLAKKYPCQKEHVLKPAYYKSDKYRKGKEKGE
ncbi:MAG: ATPase, T2SS/T4P/T4SS family, partial [Anaerovoracaceae bacterium]